MSSLSVTSQFLDLPEGRIAYDDSGGAGKIVLAIPGMGDVRHEYRFLRPQLTAAGYRVVTMEIRGHGESSAAWPDYSARAVARDAVALIDHLDTRSAIIAGTSFAAGSPLWAMYDAPAKVAGGILISPILKDYPIPFMTNLMMKIGFAGPWRVGFWMMYYDSLFPSHKPSDYKAYRTAVASMLHETGRMDALMAMAALPKSDTAELIAPLPKPAILIGGSRDLDFPNPTAELEFLAAKMAIRSVVVDGVGHYPQVEAPDITSAAILEFLRALD